jgi:hypothetical protein
LAPKSYYAFCLDKETDSVKIASKGVSHNNKYEYEEYKRCLYENVNFDATNFSMREFDGTMCTIKTRKRGLSAVHVKTLVLEDKVQTVPHKIAKYTV